MVNIFKKYSMIHIFFTFIHIFIVGSKLFSELNRDKYFRGKWSLKIKKKKLFHFTSLTANRFNIIALKAPKTNNQKVCQNDFISDVVILQQFPQTILNSQWFLNHKYFANNFHIFTNKTMDMTKRHNKLRSTKHFSIANNELDMQKKFHKWIIFSETFSFFFIESKTQFASCAPCLQAFLQSKNWSLNNLCDNYTIGKKKV